MLHFIVHEKSPFLIQTLHAYINVLYKIGKVQFALSDKVRLYKSCEKVNVIVGLKMFTLVVVWALVGLALANPVATNWPRELAEISVTNGGQEGHWYSYQVCPNGTGAAGFSIKVQPITVQDLTDDETTLNGVRLHCSDGNHPDEVTIASKYGERYSYANLLLLLLLLALSLPPLISHCRLRSQ